MITMAVKYNTKKYIEDRVCADINKLHCRKKPKVVISKTLREPSAITRGNTISFNKDYIDANKTNKRLVNKLVSHEVSHVATNSGDNDVKFKQTYKKLTGSSNTQSLPNEKITGVKYVYVCPCGYRYYFFRHPISNHVCPECGHKLHLKKIQ